MRAILLVQGGGILQRIGLLAKCFACGRTVCRERPGGSIASAYDLYRLTIAGRAGTARFRR